MVTICALPFGLQAVFGSVALTAAVSIAYVAWVLTRPRMRRVWLRIQGEPVLNTWERYFDEPAANQAPAKPSKPVAPPLPATTAPGLSWWMG